MIATRLLVLLLLWTTPVAAQSPSGDAVLAGYQRLYAGEREASYKHFEALRSTDSKAIAPWFGQLFAHQARIQFEPALAPAFETNIADFLAHVEQRYARSHADAEALFYLAQGYLLRSTYRLDHDKGVFGAARDGSKAKGYIDTYVKQHPEHGDAYLVLGLYNYYVDIAPAFIKVLRVLLFLPAGNRSEGLKQLERAGREGSLFAPLADAALAEIYGSYEGRLRDAIKLGERLVERFPTSADMRFDLADRYMNPAIEAYDSAAAQFTAIIEQKTGSSLEELEARYRATSGMANLRRNQWRIEDAIAILKPAIEQGVTRPEWVLPSFLLRRANFRALLNDPGAVEDARRVASDKRPNWQKSGQQQITFIANRRKTSEAPIYASLIPGNRLTIEHRWDEAIAVYDEVAAAYPGNWQVKYRRAYLEFLRANYDASARGFSEIASANAVPSWIKAAALLNLGWTHDLGGRRAEAVKLYQRIVDDFENEAPAGAARIGLITPYRRG